MALNPSESAASIRWDLSDLYTSTDDPNLDKDLKIVEESAAALSSEYRGRIEKLNGTELSSFLSQYEACLEQIGKISTFAHLSWSTDTGNPQRGALLQKLTERSARLHQTLLFFELEWTYPNLMSVIP